MMKARIVFPLFLFVASSVTWGSDTQSLLAAWEDLQRTSDKVSRFEKTGDRQYQIEFDELPYAGTLEVLAVGIEEFPSGAYQDINITKTGYVEVDLPDISEEELNKYGRVYYGWTRLNTLYYNADTGDWISDKAYNQLMTESAVSGGTSWFAVLSEYWFYVFIFIILFFFFSHIIDRRKIKQSLALQQEAQDAVDESLRLQQNAIDKSVELHSETNRLLAEIKDSLSNSQKDSSH